jgi:(1->4)-alpha-D-glucan 1-alpha-D-glucosylmutase
VPDIYQGTELWDFSLVDPDNPRLVDFERRRALLKDLQDRIARSGQNLISLAKELLENSQDGRIKLYLISQTLNFRRLHKQLFSEGVYHPLEGNGEKKDHLCSFARTLGNEAILVVIPRLVVGLTGGVEQPPLGEDLWKDTWLNLPPELAGQTYRNLFTGERLFVGDRGIMPRLPLAKVFSYFPVAFWERIAK